MTEERKMQWAIQVAGVKEVAVIDAFLCDEWEPFAVSDNRIFFRKVVAAHQRDIQLPPKID
jgi:hypothetical protein